MWDTIEGGMKMFYRRNGTPYPNSDEGTREWARDFENMAYRRIALDHLSNNVEISTVWIGIDHRFSARGRPLIFETMLFMPSGQSIGEQWRYSTEEEAIRGHKMLVKKWQKMKAIDQIIN